MSTVPANEPECHELPDADAVDMVIAGRGRPVGSIRVARVLPAPERRLVGPFVFLDHMGPVTLEAGAGFDVPPHPHIGLSTVTYFLAGENVHRDSLGTVQVNRPGDLNLMTAGRGVVHSERAEPSFRERGGVMHGLQMWLALRAEHEGDAPSFEHHPRATLPEIAPAPGVRGRVLLGEAYGARSPVVHASDPWLVELELDAGATVSVAGPEPERGIFVIAGELRVGETVLPADRLAVLRPGARAALTASAPSHVVLLGGPSPGARFIDWNFVSSSREELVRAREAWRAEDTRVFPTIPGDSEERVPYPGPPRQG